MRGPMVRRRNRAGSGSGQLIVLECFRKDGNFRIGKRNCKNCLKTGRPNDQRTSLPRLLAGRRSLLALPRRRWGPRSCCLGLPSVCFR